MSHPRGLKRKFGVKQVPEEPKERFVRPEGSSEPIVATSTLASADPSAPRRSVPPKRYAQMQIEKARGAW